MLCQTAVLRKYCAWVRQRTYGALMSGKRILSHPTPRLTGVASSDVSSLGSARKCATGGTALKPKLRCSSGQSQFSAASSGLNTYARWCMSCTVRSVRFSFWRGAAGMLTWVLACCDTLVCQQLGPRKLIYGKMALAKYVGAHVCCDYLWFRICGHGCNAWKFELQVL